MDIDVDPTRDAVRAKVDQIRESVDDNLEQIARSLEASPCNSRSPEVVAELERDGHRYTLTRTPISQTPRLSGREREIARLVAEGMPNKAIGRVLDISQWTVASYLRRIFEKLGVTTRAEMVRVTFQHHLLNLDPPSFVRE